MKNRYAQVALAGCAALLAGLLPAQFGCNQSIPAITIDIPLAQSTTFPPAGVPLQPGIPFNDLSVPLGAQRCEFPNADALEAQVRAVAGSIGTFVEIESVVIDRVTFKSTDSSLGDLSFLDEVELAFETTSGNDTDTVVFGARSENGLDDPFSLESEDPFDVWAFLSGDAECLEGALSVSGEFPQDPVTFSATLTITLQLRVVR